MVANSCNNKCMAPVALRFGVFFDGTGNNQNNVAQPEVPVGMGASYANALSNVALLHALYPGQGADAEGRMGFLKQYVEGVGTLAGEPDQVYASATGSGSTGVAARATEALAAIAEQLRGWCQAHPQARPERVEFDLFGFSRGGGGSAASGQPAARQCRPADAGALQAGDQFHRPVRHRGGDRRAVAG